jgi:mRNA-degrading endonuclease RelE of RelBE toxin-antitoxin system
MSFEVVVSPAFERQIKRLIKKYTSLKQDIKPLFDTLEVNPVQGTPIGKDCYKIRLAISSKGKGKSGGARVITCAKVVAGTVYLLSIYDKSEKEDLEEKELDKLLKMAGIEHAK